MENEEKSITNSGQGSPWAVPGAILISGILIAGAVIYGGGTKVGNTAINDDNANVAGQQEEAITLSQKDLKKVANFQACLNSGKYATRVSENLADGIASGGQGTPWSIVVVEGGAKYPINGALSYEQVKAVLDKALAEAKNGSTKGQSNGQLDSVAKVTRDDHILGDINAPVKIIEFSDPECPYCKRFHTTMEQIIAEYGKGGQVAWVYRHFPLDSIHPKSRKEAEAIECAGEQGKFWEYTSKIYEVTPSNNKLDPNQLYKIAIDLGLN